MKSALELCDPSYPQLILVSVSLNLPLLLLILIVIIFYTSKGKKALQEENVLKFVLFFMFKVKNRLLPNNIIDLFTVNRSNYSLRSADLFF